MKNLIAAAICAMFALSPAFAQDKAEPKKAVPAVEKKVEMKADVKADTKAEKKADIKVEKKADMKAEKKTDMKADKPKKAPSEAQKKQQERMKDCNTKAEGKSGDDRKKFMSTCLKG